MSRFLRFAAVGVAGFLVDVAVLWLALNLLGLDKYSARVLSYLCAATFTWSANRRVTFADRRATGASAMVREWAAFLLANLGGAAVNYGTYAALVTFAHAPFDSPYLGAAAGSIAGLFVNFAASSRFVFKAR